MLQLRQSDVNFSCNFRIVAFVAAADSGAARTAWALRGYRVDGAPASFAAAMSIFWTCSRAGAKAHTLRAEVYVRTHYAEGDDNDSSDRRCRPGFRSRHDRRPHPLS